MRDGCGTVQEEKKSKFSPSEKDLERIEKDKEEIEKLKKVTLGEIDSLDSEIKKRRKKNWVKICLIIVIVFGIIKLLFGMIELYNIFGYPAGKARFYMVTVNGEANTVSYNLRHKIPVIPFLVNFNSYYLGNSNIVGDNDDIDFYEDGSSQYLIGISSYSCYVDNHQVECNKSSQVMKENEDTRYTNLRIVRTSNPYEEVYNGKFIKDITPYVREKGFYYVGITAKYSLVETEVYFYFRNKV